MHYLLFVLTILFTSLLSYFLSMNLIFTIVVSSLFILYFISLEVTLQKKINIKVIKNRDVNYFLHDFLLSYLDNKDLKFCIKSTNRSISNNLKEELRMLDEYSGMAILNNLENYFSSSLYSLFLFTLKNKNNVDSLKFIFNENIKISKTREEIKKKNKKALWEFSILWLVSFIVLIVLRISLNNYFNKLHNSFYYLIGISIYFLFLLLSINLFVITYFRREKL